VVFMKWCFCCMGLPVAAVERTQVLDRRAAVCR